MRFGSVDMFTDFSDWRHRMGRPVANESFLKALLTYGTFDQYTFFCPDHFHMEQFTARIESLLQDPVLISRVEATLQITLSEAIRETPFHVIHLGDFTYYMPYLISLRNRSAKKPFPITGVTHSLDGVFMNLRYLELLLSQPAPYDRIICTSRCAVESVKKGLAHVGRGLVENLPGVPPWKGPALELIPLGIEDSLFEAGNRTEARQFFRIPENRVLALSIGRMSARQKTDWIPFFGFLARMAAQGRLQQLLVVLAGGADESNITLIKNLIQHFGLSDTVLLFPNFPEHLKAKLYHAADFYLSIVDNFQETFGLNILEAMAAGLPVIASNFSGYRDLVSHLKSGFLIDTLWSTTLPEFVVENIGILSESMTRFYMAQSLAVDLEQLEAAVFSLYNRSDLRKEMGNESQNIARKYRWPEIIRAYEKLWDDLSKAATKTTPGSREPKAEILEGDPAQIFSHYPSRLLTDQSLLEIPPGDSILGRAPAGESAYEDLLPCLFPELKTLLFRALEKRKSSLGELKREASRQIGASGGQTVFHVLWCLKQGYLRLASP